MSQSTLNGKTAEQAILSTPALPAAPDNPFLVPSRTTSLGRNVSFPVPPGRDAKLTKKQVGLLEEGGAQAIQQYLQRAKAAFAIAATAQIEDQAGQAFVQVASNMAVRTQRAFHPPEVQPYLNLYMDAALRRYAIDVQQIASTHHGAQNEIAAKVVEVEEENPKGFFERLFGNG